MYIIFASGSRLAHRGIFTQFTTTGVAGNTWFTQPTASCHTEQMNAFGTQPFRSVYFFRLPVRRRSAGRGRNITRMYRVTGCRPPVSSCSSYRLVVPTRFADKIETFRRGSTCSLCLAGKCNLLFRCLQDLRIKERAKDRREGMAHKSSQIVIPVHEHVAATGIDAEVADEICWDL